jgi:23S rRNA (cytosine1962-C5)-methyltransferase
MTYFYIASSDVNKVKQDQKVYSSDIRKVERDYEEDLFCHVLTTNGKFVAFGYYNFLSKIRIRFLSYQPLEKIDQAWIEKRIQQIVHQKEALGYHDHYRVIYDENDFMPGLVVDKFGGSLVLQITSLGMEKLKSDLVTSLVNIFHPHCIYNKSDLATRTKEGLQPITEVLYGTPQVEEIKEHDLLLAIDYVNGQKTGYYLDQSQNRYLMRQYAQGRDCLDLFCNQGGFALNLLKGGAKSVVAVDTSSLALEQLKFNMEKNQLTGITTIQENCFDVLREYIKNKTTFDLIILDPPALTHDYEFLNKAKEAYLTLNRYALNCLRPGGILLTCSCSGHLSLPVFLEVLKKASAMNNTLTKLLAVNLQAPDHAPLINTEYGIYLKTVILQKVEF